MAVAGATAITIATATAGAGGASADELRFDDDILPPAGPTLQQGLAAQAPPAYPGFATLSWLANYTLQLRKAYTIRLIGAESEPFRSAAAFAAQQLKTISDVTITVAPGTLPEEPQSSTPGDILIFTDVDTCQWYAVACARPGGLTQWPTNVRRIDGGYLWIKPEVTTRPIGEIRLVVAHELGHVLGLDHYSPEFEGQLQAMHPSAQFDTGGVYRQGDKNGIKFVSPPPSQFTMRNDNPPYAAVPWVGVPETFFGFGSKGDIPLKGDWDGDGIDTPGVFRPSYYFFSNFALRNSNTPGPANVELSFGLLPGDIPIAGDWNGDGTDTIGILRGNTFHLRNSNAPVSSSTSFSLADLTTNPLGPNDKVVTGDWDGDGIDTVGIYRSFAAGGGWYMTNSHTQNAPYTVYGFGVGAAGPDKPVVGDWDGDGDDTIGVKRGERWILRNARTNSEFNLPQFADVNSKFGEAADTPIAGDWDGDGDDTVGAHR